ncbi:VOC family protein [Nocardia sp. NEAU-G5]|uniref:VOC family protein n=1 Tax=Nocardia albiluteola TaxID=2842303 RepID=A0ABS6B987_9NOCA|nr:VOC family protein [Nocardia albiluteola]MBU3066867.1 VOC family protein [Nocardia albiluteola]
MTNSVNPIPEGYHSINCFLAVPDADAAIEFYGAVFGAEVLSRNDLPDGQAAHAELKVGDSTFQLGMPIPSENVLAPNPDWVHTSVVHYCPDVDAVTKLAREHGAKRVTDPETFVTGDRFGLVMDPFGHRWVIMTRVEDVSREEAERRVNEWMANQSNESDQ